MLLVYPVFGQTLMKEKSNNWTKQTTDTRPGTEDGNNGGDPSDPTGPTTPVGDTAWALIAGLGLVYGIYVFNRKKKAVKE